MKYQFYAIIFDVSGNQVSSKSTASPLSITTATQLVTSLSISPNAAQTKNIGETFIITPTVGPANANNKNVNWTSSNTNVATVSKATTASGTAVIVTCKTAGTATITATTADGSNNNASLDLTVISPLNSLTLDKTEIIILKGNRTAKVIATTDPIDYEANKISWSISNNSIATVNVTGKEATITSSDNAGTTTLNVTAGDFTKTVNIIVNNFTTQTFSYSGSSKQVELPAGKYKLQVWGAQGGSNGGKGGYAEGVIQLFSNETVFICVGSQPSSRSGGYNGGGSGGSGNSSGYGGGGATDIRLSGNSISNRILVAGGGGGTGGKGEGNNGSGGASGVSGTTGGYGTCGCGYSGAHGGGGGAGIYASLAKGGSGGAYGAATSRCNGTGSGYPCGGGGGRWRRILWWPVAVVVPLRYIVQDQDMEHLELQEVLVKVALVEMVVHQDVVVAVVVGGGGGSSYANTSILTSTITQNGNTSFSSTSGGTETGHSGNGYAIITPVN